MSFLPTFLSINSLFRNWRGIEIDGAMDVVSCNHVDSEGNSALHLACTNNLIECICILISFGAIISIVNKDQKNCCEVADMAGFPALADALELAVLYQPEDDVMSLFNEEHRFPFENKAPVYIIDAM